MGGGRPLAVGPSTPGVTYHYGDLGLPGNSPPGSGAREGWGITSIDTSGVKPINDSTQAKERDDAEQDKIGKGRASTYLTAGGLGDINSFSRSLLGA